MRDPRAFASAIKEIRGKRTQREVAEGGDIDPATWSAYEQGKRWPRSWERFEQIARALGVSLDDLERLTTEHQMRRRGGVPRSTPDPKPTAEEEGPALADATVAGESFQQQVGATLARIAGDLTTLLALLLRR